jgi:hypothetical protein
MQERCQEVAFQRNSVRHLHALRAVRAPLGDRYFRSVVSMNWIDSLGMTEVLFFI